MISDYEIAQYCVGLYGYPDERAVQFDHVEPGDADPGICWALKHLDHVDLIVLRGTSDIRDWLCDFDTVADPFDDSSLGPVHPGFHRGLEHAWAAIKPLLRAPAILAGHSLGAGRADILCGIMLVDGAVVERRVLFGEPRPGFKKLATLIGSVRTASYRNGDDYHHDLVTDVPFSFPPEEYIHPCPLLGVCSPPTAAIKTAWGMFAWHHMTLYRNALFRGFNAVFPLVHIPLLPT